MKFSFRFLFLVFVALSTGLMSVKAQSSFDEKDPLLLKTQILPYEWQPGQGGELQIEMTLPDDFYAYEDKFNIVILEPAGYKIGALQITPLKTWYDKFSKRDRTGIQNSAVLKANLEAPPRFLKNHKELKFDFTYQACSSQFCLFPLTKTVSVPIVAKVTGAEIGTPTNESLTSEDTGSLFDAANFEKTLASGIFTGLFFVFIAGIFTSFTPCIFPMIPITLAVLGNESNKRSRLMNFITSCFYVLGIATTYSILGLIAASSGSLFGASLGNPYVLAVICAIFLAMSLSMYGLFDLQVPAFIRNRLGSGKSKGLGGAYLTGLFAGIVASPCVGPVLVAILTYVASTQDMLLGFLYLFFYALGLGMIFLALGLSNQLLKNLPRSGVWMNSFKFILGTLMLSAFYYYLELLLPSRWFDGALGLGLIILASAYGAFQTLKETAYLRRIQKGLMQAVLFIGIISLSICVFDLRPYIYGRVIDAGAVSELKKLAWTPYSEEAVAAAKASNKPVIIDFWADWCAACHELEQQTFTDPRIRARSDDFVLLKFDATKDSDSLKALKKKYRIQGLPTLIFLNKQGDWLESLTLTQFEKADSFLKRMDKGAQ
ncbi:thiol:disulfide interchange protein [Bdellovibrio bacteriovorus W]|nr:thiol:disulfide interchange protein [Bdellovibrio bacteriovorus W]